MCVLLPQYSVPVVKYDRNGFRPRLRQLVFTQEAAYLVEEAKIKQRIDYNSLKGNCGEEVSAGGAFDMLSDMTLFSHRCVSQQPERQLPDPSRYM